MGYFLSRSLCGNAPDDSGDDSQAGFLIKCDLQGRPCRTQASDRGELPTPHSINIHLGPMTAGYVQVRTGFTGTVLPDHMEWNTRIHTCRYTVGPEIDYRPTSFRVAIPRARVASSSREPTTVEQAWVGSGGGKRTCLALECILVCTST